MALLTAMRFRLVSRGAGTVLLAGKVLGRLRLRRLQRLVNRVGHGIVLRYLKRTQRGVIARYVGAVRPPGSDGEQLRSEWPTWVCWWQGREAAPPVVALCLRALEQRAPRLVVLDAANFAQYADIDQQVVDRMRQGRMSLTHFSDVLRFNLLRNHGGLWIDATVYASKPIPHDLLRGSFYTRKTASNRFGENVSERRWSTFLIGGHADLTIWSFLDDFLREYWRTHDTVVNYFLTDYAMAIAYELNIGGFAEMVDLMPHNNAELDEMVDLLGRTAHPDLAARLVASDSLFYKLSWRMEPPLVSAGEVTTYGALLDLTS